MNLDERLSILAGADTWHTPATSEVPAIRMSDGPAGVRGTSWDGPPSASFPCGTALAATFDPGLVREVGRALGREARSKNANVLLGPTVNLHRTPIGGRNFECMSEDPRHTAAIAVAYVDGVQSERVACCIKHFVGNDTEYRRMTISSEISEQVLRELYLVPFEAAVGAGVRSIMTGYNRLNGTYCSEHEWLLGDVLRGEWGFDGVVVSDWFGTHSTAAALRAGLDIEMPGPPRYRGPLLRAEYDAGAIGDAEVDAAVARIAALAEWTGAATTGTSETTADDPETRAVMRRAAAAGTVLLRNEQSVLPLEPGARIALIGPYAATGRVQGGGSARVTPDRPSAILPALRSRGFEVDHTVGCTIHKTLPALRGDFELTVFDPRGVTASSRLRRTDVLWQDEPSPGFGREFGARISGTFVPDVGGEWRVGARAVGPVLVKVDGDVVLSIDEAETGGSFFGNGSHEHTATVTLVEGQAHTIEIEYPLAAMVAGAGMRALAVGAAPPELDDPVRVAAELAAAADVAVLVVGTNDQWETEGEDRTSLALPGRQDELVGAVAAANPRTVVVVNAGSPVAMPWIDDVAAVLHCWFPGGEIGHALTDVLAGDAEPGGRLPVTFPKRLEDTPAFEHYPGDGERADYGEGLLIGHRWYEATAIEPLFPFGHGLGYTTFDIEPDGIRGTADGGVDVNIALTNTGGRPGAEVVQVYVRLAGDPFRRFAASRKVSLVPGERTTVSVHLDARAFSVWTDAGWQVPPGRHDVEIGRSSADVVAAGALEDGIVAA